MGDAMPAAMQVGNPFRRPDWRWRRAAAVVAAGQRCSKAKDDPETFGLAAFLRADAKCRTAAGRRRLAERWPGLPEDAALAAGPPLRKAEMEARLLAAQVDADIAARTGLPAAAVAWYAAAYFDVRPRLSARDWIAFRAIGVLAGGGLPAGDVGPLLKTAGYHGGLVALDLVLAVVAGAPVPPAYLPADPAAAAYAAARLQFGVRQWVAAQQAMTPEGLAAVVRSDAAAARVDHAQRVVPPALAKADRALAAELRLFAGRARTPKKATPKKAKGPPPAAPVFSPHTFDFTT